MWCVKGDGVCRVLESTAPGARLCTAEGSQLRTLATPGFLRAGPLCPHQQHADVLRFAGWEVLLQRVTEVRGALLIGKSREVFGGGDI